MVEGHSLAQRVRAGRDIRVEGTSTTASDSVAGQDVVVRPQGAPERPKA